MLWFVKMYVMFRYLRLTTRRYGMLAVVMRDNYRPKRAGVGHGMRSNPLGRAHQAGTDAMTLVRSLKLERSNDKTEIVIVPALTMAA